MNTEEAHKLLSLAIQPQAVGRLTRTDWRRIDEALEALAPRETRLAESSGDPVEIEQGQAPD